MAVLEIPGVALNFEVDGPDDATAILLIHAGVANLRMWDPLVPALSTDHRVIRYDTRNFGLTGVGTGEYTDFGDAIALLDHLGIETATIVGSSRGGGIGIDLAVAHPDRVAGLVTIGSAPGGHPGVAMTPHEDALFDRIDALEKLGEWEAAIRLEAEVWNAGPERPAAEVDPATLARFYELALANLPHAGRQRPPGRLDPPAFGRLSEIVVPVLATVGDLDVSDVIVTTQSLRDLVPGAESHTFTGTAHLPSVEQPEEFARVLREWLLRHNL